MRTIVCLLSGFFLLLSAVQCTSPEKALNKKLVEMAAGLNESAPVMLDRYTRFEGASVTPENVFRYSYTVVHATNADSLVEKGLEAIKGNIGKEFASNPDLRVFTENNVHVEYVYNDENGRTIRSLQITPDDYR